MIVKVLIHNSKTIRLAYGKQTQTKLQYVLDMTLNCSGV